MINIDSNEKEIEFFESANKNSLMSIFKLSRSYSSIDLPPLGKEAIKLYIYILIDGNRVVYFGASSDRRRISYHKDKEFELVVFYYSEQAFLLESILIKRFMTKYNKCSIAIKNHFSVCMHCDNRQDKSIPHKVLDQLPPTFSYGKDNELLMKDNGFDFVDCACNNGHPKYEFTCNKCFIKHQQL